MLLRDFIEKLKEFPQDLPVTIADFNEDHAPHSEPEAEKIWVDRHPNSEYASCDSTEPSDQLTAGSHVVIGSYHPAWMGPSDTGEAESCECDDGMRRCNKVCRWCWARGRRRPDDPQVEEDHVR